MDNSFPIFISTGDPWGIGPEISIKALTHFKNRGIFLIGGIEQLKNIGKKFSLTDLSHSLKYSEKLKLPLKPSPESGKLSFEFLLKAMNLAIENNGVLITAPISKEMWLKAGIKYRGHTEFFEDYFKRKAIMSFFSEEFKIALFTHHIPLKKFWNFFSKESLKEFFRILHREVNKRFDLSLKLHSASLNPHAGEDGFLGDEEKDIIIPVIDELSKEGIQIEYPLPNDTLFYKLKGKKDRLIISYTHDLGLIPFKLTSFDSGVNITLNLPMIRTSPDHGTAFDIAGKGIANEKSMVEAIRYAILLKERENA